MSKKLSLLVLVLEAILLASCAPFESYPQQQTSTTTTTTCPAGKQLQSDGMCWWPPEGYQREVGARSRKIVKLEREHRASH